MRVAPHVQKIARSLGQGHLFRVCNAYASYDSAVGYCQGIGFIAGLFLMYMSEEEAFWMLDRVCRGPGFHMHGIFSPGLPRLEECFYQLRGLEHRLMPRVAKKFERLNILPALYATQPFMTLCAHSFPRELVLRIMDIFLSEGVKIIFRIVLFLLERAAPEILAGDEEAILPLVNHLYRDPILQDADAAIAGALAISISTKSLKHLSDKFRKSRAG